MRISSRQYAEGLYGALHGATPEERGGVIDRFLALIVRSRAKRLLPAILGHLERLDERATGQKRITLTLSRKASNEAAQSILPEAKRLFGAGATLRVSTDPTLIGGGVFQTETERVDASVGGRLREFKRFLEAS